MAGVESAPSDNRAPPVVQGNEQPVRHPPIGYAEMLPRDTPQRNALHTGNTVTAAVGGMRAASAVYDPAVRQRHAPAPNGWSNGPSTRDVQANARRRGPRMWNQLYQKERRDIYCIAKSAMAGGAPVSRWGTNAPDCHFRAELVAFNGWCPVAVLADQFGVTDECLLEIVASGSFVTSGDKRWLRFCPREGDRQPIWRRVARDGINSGEDIEAHRRLAQHLYPPIGFYEDPPAGYTPWRDF